MKQRRRHLLICRGASDGLIRAAYDGGRWIVDVDRPTRLETVLLSTLPALLPQLASADFTLSPCRGFAGFDCPPDEIALPDVPVMLACPIGNEPHGQWQWLIYHSASQPPFVSGQRFAEATLQDEVANKLKLNDARASWAADKEIWVRHDLSHAELIPA